MARVSTIVLAVMVVALAAVNVAADGTKQQQEQPLPGLGLCLVECGGKMVNCTTKCDMKDGKALITCFENCGAGEIDCVDSCLSPKN